MEKKKFREQQTPPIEGQSLGNEKADIKRRTFITAGLSAAFLAALCGVWYAANHIPERPNPAATDEERASVAAKIRENLMSRLWDLTDDPESEPWRRQAAEDTLRDIYRARNDGDLLQGEYFRGQYRTPDGVVWFQRAVLENLYQSALNDALADPDTKRIVDSDPEEIQGRAFYWPEPVITPKQREVYSQNLGRGWGKFVYRYPALNHELFNSPVQLMRLLKSNLFDFEEQAKAFVRLLEHLENPSSSIHGNADVLALIVTDRFYSGHPLMKEIKDKFKKSSHYFKSLALKDLLLLGVSELETASKGVRPTAEGLADWVFQKLGPGTEAEHAVFLMPLFHDEKVKEVAPGIPEKAFLEAYARLTFADEISDPRMAGAVIGKFYENSFYRSPQYFLDGFEFLKSVLPLLNRMNSPDAVNHLIMQFLNLRVGLAEAGKDHQAEAEKKWRAATTTFQGMVYFIQKTVDHFLLPPAFIHF